MEVSITDHQLPNETHNLYDVTFFTHQIHTLLTHSPPLVDQWIAETHQIHQSNPANPSIVGLDVEWRPNFRRYQDNLIAILQLCVGHRCLIFQVMHSPFIPQSLREFLGDKNGGFVFVGVGIKNDVEKLRGDYELGVGSRVDLRGLAVEKLGEIRLKNAGLKQLTRRVLGKEIQKPKSVSMSRWDYQRLTPAQVKYACLDAFLSCEIGRNLFSKE